MCQAWAVAETGLLNLIVLGNILTVEKFDNSS